MRHSGRNIELVGSFEMSILVLNNIIFHDFSIFFPKPQITQSIFLKAVQRQLSLEYFEVDDGFFVFDIDLDEKANSWITEAIFIVEIRLRLTLVTLGLNELL